MPSVLILYLGQSGISTAGELKVIKRLDTTYSTSEQTATASENTSSSKLLLAPSLLTTFKGNRLDASLSIKESVVKSNDSQEDQNYSDIRLNSKFDIIENMLIFTAIGNQSYRSVSQIDNILNDQLAPDRNLTKTKSFNTGASFKIPNPIYFGIELQGTYSKSEASNTINEGESLDTNNDRYIARFYNGKNFNLLSFDFNAAINKSSRADNSNFDTSLLTANIGFKVVSDLEVIVRGSSSKYDTNGNANSTFGERNSDSYGAGVRWSPSKDRFIEVSYNTFDESDTNVNYLGGSASWAVSQRTKFGFTYDKRFYGDAYKVNLDYNLKSFRSSLSYDESVTSYARTTIDSGQVGLFVCPIGSSDFIECFQPSSLDYILEPGEEFRSFSGVTDDITDEIFIRKNGRLNFSYQKRKIKASLTLGYLRSEYLESERLQTDKTANVNVDYQAGKKTNFGASIQFAKRESGDTLTSSSDTVSYNTTVTRKLSQNAKVNAGLRYLERNSSQGDITDKRLTLGFTYSF
ncbi:MAG: hypothetical protein NWQ54_11470 [Paraglaciecola sp.]|nr:hypothetical protein [Paraglaciecola sp.]